MGGPGGGRQGAADGRAAGVKEARGDGPGLSVIFSQQQPVDFFQWLLQPSSYVIRSTPQEGVPKRQKATSLI